MSALRNIGAIWWKEMGSYFLSPIAYVVIFLFMIYNGALLSFFTKVFTGHPRQVPLVIEELFGRALFWVLPLSPLITMRLFAEEKRTGTFETLMTAPVTETQVVAGKFLAAQVFYCLIWLSIVPLFVILWRLTIGVPDPGPVMAMYVGVFALGLLTNAIGVLASATSRNQLVAAMLALTANLVLYLTSHFQGLFPESLDWRRVLAYLSFTTHFDSDYRLGIVDPRYLVLYASLALFFLFVTVRVVEARKWR